MIHERKNALCCFSGPSLPFSPFFVATGVLLAKNLGREKKRKMIGASKYLFIFLPAEPLSYSLPLVVPPRTLVIVLLFVGTGVRASLIGTF